MSIPNYHNRKLANDLLIEHGTTVVGKAITLQKLTEMGLSEYHALRAICQNTAIQRLPDSRYSADLIYGGWPDGPRFVPTFCGEWIKDDNGEQRTGCKTREADISYCIIHREQFTKDLAALSGV
jgi:hypothetical protein